MAVETVAITDTADDVNESVFGFATDAIQSGDIFGSPIYAGLRFQGVNVPQGATIDSAILTLNIASLEGGATPSTYCYGVDADTAAAWADPGNLPSAVTPTTAQSATFAPIATGSEQVDVTTIVQEIIDRVGWSSGNALALVFNDDGTSSNEYWIAEDFEDAGTAEASLEITYTAGGLSIPVAYRHYQRMKKCVT